MSSFASSGNLIVTPSLPGLLSTFTQHTISVLWPETSTCGCFEHYVAHNCTLQPQKFNSENAFHQNTVTEDKIQTLFFFVAFGGNSYEKQTIVSILLWLPWTVRKQCPFDVQL